MVARMLMYRTVYRHKTALIVASIANDALEALNPDFEDFVAWNDCDFLSELKTNDLKTYEAIKNRRIPKGILVKCSQEEFLGVVERFEGKIMSSQYLKSPFKKEVLNVLTNGEIRPMTDFSSIMEFLERELEGMGLLVFENENEEYIRDALRRMNITGQ